MISEGGDPLGSGLPALALLNLDATQQMSLSRLGPAVVWDWLAGGFHAQTEATLQQWTSHPE